MLRAVKRFFSPRRLWRLETYFEGKNWKAFWLYLLLGWREPLDVLVIPRIREFEGFTVPNMIDLYKDLKFTDDTPSIPMDVFVEEPKRRRRFPRT